MRSLGETGIDLRHTGKHARVTGISSSVLGVVTNDTGSGAATLRIGAGTTGPGADLQLFPTAKRGRHAAGPSLAPARSAVIASGCPWASERWSGEA